MVVSPRLFHLASRSPVSPQLPAPHLRLLHGCIPESLVLLRPDSLPAFSLAATLRRFVLSALTYQYFRPSSTVGVSRCLWLAPRSPYLSHSPIRAGVPFHPFSPVFRTSSHRCVFPFFLSLAFPSLIPSFNRGYRYKEHESTCALILTRLRRCIARMQIQCIILVNQIKE